MSSLAVNAVLLLMASGVGAVAPADSAEFLHVKSIVPGSTGGGPNKKATASVTIHDETGAAAEGATVTATFSGSHNETVFGQSNSSGEASLTTSVKNSTVSFRCVWIPSQRPQ